MFLSGRLKPGPPKNLTETGLLTETEDLDGSLENHVFHLEEKLPWVTATTYGSEIWKKHIPSQETNLSHRKRKGESSTQKCLGRGYVSSLEGKILILQLPSWNQTISVGL